MKSHNGEIYLKTPLGDMVVFSTLKEGAFWVQNAVFKSLYFEKCLKIHILSQFLMVRVKSSKPSTLSS